MIWVTLSSSAKAAHIQVSCVVQTKGLNRTEATAVVEKEAFYGLTDGGIAPDVPHR